MLHPSRTGGAPDDFEVRVGWRVWDVVELDGALRLCSLAFWSIWLPRVESIALCRRSLVEAGLAGLPPHDAPQGRCTCGIYATQTAAQVLDYSRGVKRRSDTVSRVVGRVSLWGTVIECKGGWRASHAYPSALLVPTARRRLPRLGQLGRPLLPAEEIAVGLGDYLVPVEIVDVTTERELRRLLEPRTPPS